MNFYKYYQKNRTYITHSDQRLIKIINLVEQIGPKNLLDIGCGDGYLLKELRTVTPTTKLFGVDVYKTKINGIEIKEGDITKGLPFKDNSFECVILGEVIEHLPDPDFALSEIRRVLKKGGVLIISTPNLVSWANRLMVLFGIQPFFTETSTQVNLGRRFKILGQGGKVQGHLKIFTHRSLEEILIRENFKIDKKFGVPFFFPFPVSLIDRFFTHFISLTSGLLYTCKK
jgi:SAM-dependent methyltransferase